MQIFRCFDIDLNKDEVDDKIAVFIGPFFSATTEGNFILEEMENGFYKIKILEDQTVVELIYDKKKKEYEMHLMDIK